mmetsp:Transcript_2987/g.18777  ORF Transcript_2987/g.18777 Transcript_2987/m.18777 type:complete len:204 (-) Transcript_2987:250-861(-)
MELDKLQVLEWDPRSDRHCVPIAGARMGGSCREVRFSIPACGQDGVMCSEAVQGPIFQAHGNHAFAFAVVHQQIQCEVLHEELGVMFHGLSIQRVQHGVTCAICSSAASVGLSSSTEVEALSTKRTLVDLSFFGAGERESVVFQLDDRFGCFSAHVLNGILVSQPIATFDGVVRMPSPIVFGHVSEGCVDSTLSGHGVGSGWE